jgi:hypothetical protein
MKRLPVLLFVASLLGTGCGQQPAPLGGAKAGPVPNTTPSSGSSAGQLATAATNSSTPPALPAQPEDPLAAAARKLEPLQVRVELVKSEPAGDKNETAVYEWAILARVSAAQIQVPPGMTFSAERSTVPGWAVVRVRVVFDFDKSGDNRAFDQQGGMISKPGVRQLQMHVHYRYEGEIPGLSKGSSTQDFEAKPGASPMTLTLTTWLSPKLEVPGATTLPGAREASLEVARGPLDALLQSVCKGPETFEAPKDLELLRVNGKAMSLRIVR